MKVKETKKLIIMDIEIDKAISLNNCPISELRNKMGKKTAKVVIVLARIAPATSFAHLDATTVLSSSLAELGIYPAVDPLDSTSRILDPTIVGDEHYQVARKIQEVLQSYKSLQDIIAILGMDELSEEAKLTVSRARKIQKFFSFKPKFRQDKQKFKLNFRGIC